MYGAPGEDPFLAGHAPQRDDVSRWLAPAKFALEDDLEGEFF
jgi:hypothetical protein